MLALAAFALLRRPERDAGEAERPSAAPARANSLRERLAHPALVLLIQPLLFVFAYCFTGFTVGYEPTYVVSYRYVYVVFPFLAGAAGVTLAWLWGRGRATRSVAALLLVGLTAPAAIGSARYVDLDRWGADLETDGYSYGGLGRFLVLALAERPDDLVEAVDRVYERKTPEQADEILFGAAMQIRQLLLTRKPLRARMEAVREQCEGLRARLHERVHEEHRAYFEPVHPKLPVYRIDQRAKFWTDYRARDGE